METFHWQVAPNMSEKAEPKIKIVKFGDGYEQRCKDGINNDLRSYSVTLKVAREDAQHINDFFTRHGGLHAFKWIESNSHRLITVKCPTWTSNVMNTVTTITATFEEVVA